MTISVTEAIDELTARLVGRRYGDTEILRVEADHGPDSEGDPAIFLTLVLSDPAEATWPLDDVLVMQREITDLSNQLGIDRWVHVDVQPLTDEPQADDDVPVSFP